MKEAAREEAIERIAVILGEHLYLEYEDGFASIEGKWKAAEAIYESAVPEDCRGALANALGARRAQLMDLQVTAHGYDKIAYDSELDKVDRLREIFEEKQ